ncbi:cyclic nucleotide-binding domain-containing protein [Nibrella saemangeumensis]
MLAKNWYRSLGIRPHEVRTVGLFFLHHFLLGIGTILVYVSANVILLEHHPETSLPLGYGVAALFTILVGKVYNYYEHHWSLQRLAVRVLAAVGVLTLLTIILVEVGNSVALAIAIMVGYRVIYLLTNLEFWGVSAVVFDVRQGKRLFSVISSGDMPAKAIGAVLAALVHSHADLEVLLSGALVAYLIALFVLYRTFRSHSLSSHKRQYWRRRVQPSLIHQLFGGNQLIYAMCLSLVTVAVVATGIEYAFFINVKHKWHNQEELFKNVGLVLSLTYLVAMLVKLLASRPALERLGIRWLLQLLPIVSLAALFSYVFVAGQELGATGQLVYFCGLYLLFEVIRRALFDPVFLVLFQPLTPRQRLHGHTLAKSVYEPLGTALASALLLAGNAWTSIGDWLPFIWMSLVAIGGIFLVRRTYRQYLHELNDALGHRFMTDEPLAFPAEALSMVVKNLRSNRPAEVITAINWLQLYQPETLGRRLPELLDHTEPRVQERALEAVVALSVPVDAVFLADLAERSTDPHTRETAARLACRQKDTQTDIRSRLLEHSDLSIRKGALLGTFEYNPADTRLVDNLGQLGKSADIGERLVALDLAPVIKWPDSTAFVEGSLQHTNAQVVTAATRAAGRLGGEVLVNRLITMLADKAHGKQAAIALGDIGPSVLPLITQLLSEGTDTAVLVRLASVGERMNVPESRRLLVNLARQHNLLVRSAALRALTKLPADLAEADVFEQILEDEWQLAQRLLHGSQQEPGLATCLRYELQWLQQRVFGLLTQLYDADTISRVRTGVTHEIRERRANALEVLENSVPRRVYLCLQALVDELPLTERIRLIDAQLEPYPVKEPILEYIIRQGEYTFTDWTISVALRRWVADSASSDWIYGYLNHPVQLLRESAELLLQPNAQASVTATGKSLKPNTYMKTTETSTSISHIERVIVLKNTRLFADTPENVLSSIAPIMREVTFLEGQEIFQKGQLGTCMYIIHDGEIGIYDGYQALAHMSKGDFFGELALLDAEPRSATAVATTDVTLLRVDQDDFYDLMEERSEVLRNIMRMLCRRIRHLNEQVRSAPVTPAGH